MNQELTHTAKQSDFGTVPTDHMYLAHYTDENWTAGEVVPFANLSLSPFTSCFHYGQMVFEGLKALRQENGQIAVFRHKDNFQRLNVSLERMGMPELPYEVWESGLLALLRKDESWVPAANGGALYIRPFVLASEERLGVRISGKYLFIIAMCPVSDYYLNPLSVKVETRFSRAAPGGVGYAKCAGNYGASFYPFKLAKEEGYDQIIWTDSVEHRYVEESGTMNLGFIIDGEFLTPPVSETILDGITRKSILTLAQEAGLTVKETPIPIAAVIHTIQDGTRVEAFGIGTAAGIAPIHTIGWEGKKYTCYVGGDAEMFRLKNRLDAIRKGSETDLHNWMTIL